MKVPVQSTILSFKSLADIESFVRRQEYVPIIHDIAKDLSRELFLAERPSVYYASPDSQTSAFDKHWKDYAGVNDIEAGKWLYWEWSGDLWHLLTAPEYYRLRTIRNRNIISPEEQVKLQNVTVSVAGLSVGLNSLLSFVRLGIGKSYRLADYDSVSLSNFNRSLYSLPQLQSQKVLTAAREVLSVDPFISIDIFPQGLKETSLSEFVMGSDLILDTFDNFALKLLLRKVAKQFRIPVISGFDVEFGSVLLVERYDTEPDLDVGFFLNGVSEESLYEVTTAEKKTAAFIHIIGEEYHSQSMLDSVLGVGKQLTGYPQLSIATSLTAGIFTYAALQVLTGKKKHSHRQYISLPDAVKGWS